MPELEPRPPIATAPLSLVLIAEATGRALAEVLPEWRKDLEKRKQPFEIIVVRSSGEAAKAESASVQDPPLMGVQLLTSERPGFGAALRTGLTVAQYPLVCYAAADGRYNPADLSKMLEAIDRLDLIAGYRVGRYAPRWLRLTRFVGRELARLVFGMPLEASPCWLGWSGAGRRWLVRWVFGVFVHDPECAFRLGRRELFSRLALQSGGTFVHSEIIAKANFVGGYLGEVPVSYRWPEPSAPRQNFWRDLRRVLSQPNFAAPEPGKT